MESMVKASKASTAYMLLAIGHLVHSMTKTICWCIYLGQTHDWQTHNWQTQSRRHNAACAHAAQVDEHNRSEPVGRQQAPSGYSTAACSTAYQWCT
jgi:hypothetical protein